jgi:DNA replication protein DnaC
MVSLAESLERNVLAVRDRLSEERRANPGPDRASLAGERELRVLLRHGEVPPKYRDESDWEQVPDSLAVPLMEWRVADILQAKLAHGRGLLLAGPVGTGKSMTAALLCREVGRLGRSVRWEYVPDMLDALSDPKTRQQVVARQRHCTLLVWDDFGVERLADWQIGHLDRIVEGRSRARRSMIITTNHTPELLRADPALARMTDRWRAMCTPMILGGPSRRTAE